MMQIPLSITWRLVSREFDFRLELLTAFIQGYSVGTNLFCLWLGFQASGNNVSVQIESPVYLCVFSLL